MCFLFFLLNLLPFIFFCSAGKKTVENSSPYAQAIYNMLYMMEEQIENQKKEANILKIKIDNFFDQIKKNSEKLKIKIEKMKECNWNNNIIHEVKSIIKRLRASIHSFKEVFIKKDKLEELKEMPYDKLFFNSSHFLSFVPMKEKMFDLQVYCEIYQKSEKIQDEIFVICDYITEKIEKIIEIEKCEIPQLLIKFPVEISKP